MEKSEAKRGERWRIRKKIKRKKLREKCGACGKIRREMRKIMEKSGGI